MIATLEGALATLEGATCKARVHPLDPSPLRLQITISALRMSAAALWMMLSLLSYPYTEVEVFLWSKVLCALFYSICTPSLISPSPFCGANFKT